MSTESGALTLLTVGIGSVAIPVGVAAYMGASTATMIVVGLAATALIVPITLVATGLYLENTG